MADINNNLQSSQSAQNKAGQKPNILPILLIVLVLVAGAVYFFYKEYGKSFKAANDSAQLNMQKPKNAELAPKNLSDEKVKETVNVVEYEVDLTNIDNIDQELDILNSI